MVTSSPAGSGCYGDISGVDRPRLCWTHRGDAAELLFARIGLIFDSSSDAYDRKLRLLESGEVCMVQTSRMTPLSSR